MAYRFVRFTPEWDQAAQRCNKRLEASGAAPFLLPTSARPVDDPQQPVRREHWLVADDTGEVRGGCLLQQQPAWLAGDEVEAVNIQSPLSEGIVDRRHAAVAACMLKQVQEKHPYSYAVGIGSTQAPFARLLQALRWRVELAPFYFRVLAGRRLLAHLVPLRRHRRLGVAARIGALIPVVPDLAFAAVHWMRSRNHSDVVAGSGQPDWRAVRQRYAFAVERSERMLQALYPDPRRFHRVSVPGGFAILCWTKCRNHTYFGNLHVATLVDAICEPGAAASVVHAATAAARAHGADLIITNQTAPDILEAVREGGWIEYVSNFVVALSPALAGRVGSGPVFVTRGDGDGLIHV